MLFYAVLKVDFQDKLYLAPLTTVSTIRVLQLLFNMLLILVAKRTGFIN